MDRELHGCNGGHIGRQVSTTDADRSGVWSVGSSGISMTFRLSFDQVVLGMLPDAYWRLGESSGTTAVDETGNGHDGEYNGSPVLGVLGLIAGDSDTSVDFDGSNDYIRLPADPVYQSVTSFTVMMWLALDYDSSGTQSDRLFVVWESGDGGNQSFLCTLNSGGFRLLKQNDDGTSDDLTVNPTYAVDEVHQVVFLWDGSDIKIYWDGTETGSLASSKAIRNRTNDAYIGQGGSGDPPPKFSVDGTLDEVAWWRRALTAQEIADLYNAGA